MAVTNGQGLSLSVQSRRTDAHSLGGSNNTKALPYSSGGPGPNMGPTGLTSRREPIPLPFPTATGACLPWPVAPQHSSLC